MNTKRNEFSDNLLFAAAALEPVDLASDPNPALNLQDAYSRALETWKGLDTAPESVRRPLRIALLSVKSVLDSTVAGRRLFAQDGEALQKAALQFREIASQISPDKSGVLRDVSSHSALGLRGAALKDLTGGVNFVVAHPAPGLRTSRSTASNDIDADMQRISRISAFRSKLPTRVPAGDPWVLAHLPVLAYTKKPLNPTALNRSGLKVFQFRNSGPAKETNVMHKKVSREEGSAYIFEDQLIVGMRLDDLKDRAVSVSNKPRLKESIERQLEERVAKEKKRRPNIDVTKLRARLMQALKKEDYIQPKALRMNDSNIVPGAPKRAIEILSKRLGSLTNPLGHLSHPFLRAPGSQIVYMWLVPDHALSTIGSVTLYAASFPWQSTETFHQRETRREDLEKELRKLNDTQIMLHKHNKELQDSDLERISELRKLLGVEQSKRPLLSPDEKRERLQEAKRMLEEEVQKQYGDLISKIGELQSELKNPKLDKDTRKETTRQISLLERRLEGGRQQIAAKLRNKLKM